MAAGLIKTSSIVLRPSITFDPLNVSIQSSIVLGAGVKGGKILRRYAGAVTMMSLISPMLYKSSATAWQKSMRHVNRTRWRPLCLALVRRRNDSLLVVHYKLSRSEYSALYPLPGKPAHGTVFALVDSARLRCRGGNLLWTPILVSLR